MAEEVKKQTALGDVAARPLRPPLCPTVRKVITTIKWMIGFFLGFALLIPGSYLKR